MSHETRQHVFLSPHPEDALLACGGLMAYLHKQGHSVLVVVLFARVPPEGEEKAPDRHFAWPPRDRALWGQVVSESAVAYHFLGVDVRYGQYMPAPFRRHPLEGRRLYPATWSYYRAPDASEGDLPLRIAGEVSTLLTPEAQVYLPLALGGHVDHVLVSRTGRLLRQQGYEVFYYEEFPEVLRDRQVEKLPQRGWHSWLLPLSQEELNFKVRAIQEYRSLVPVLFGTEREISRRVSDYMYTVSGLGYPAERYWTR